MAETITLGIVGIKNMGEYNSQTNYEKLNVVTYQGSTYCALKDTIGNLPTNSEYWQLYAEKGDVGDTGPQGPKPVKGTDYYTASDIAEIEADLADDIANEVSSSLGNLVSASPLAVSSAVEMVDTDRIYVLTTDGHWYWYDGTDWQDGGVYQASVNGNDVNTLLDNMDFIYEYQPVSQRLVNKIYSLQTTIDERIPISFETGKKYEFNLSHSQISSSSGSAIALQLYKGETTVTLVRNGNNRPEINNIQFLYECVNASDYDGIRLVLNATSGVNINLFVNKINTPIFLKNERTASKVTANFDYPTRKGRTYHLNLIKEFRFQDNTIAIKLLKDLSDTTENIQTIARTTDGSVGNLYRELTFTADDDYNYFQVYATSTSGYQNRDDSLSSYIAIYDNETNYLRESKYLVSQSDGIFEELQKLDDEYNKSYDFKYNGFKLNLKQNTFDFNNYLQVMNYSDQAVQGMAIHNDYAFQLYDDGYCSIYKLSTKELINNFALGSNLPTNHCGNAYFGPDFPSGNTDFPALYVSGDLTNFCCYVENIDLEGSTLIQKIDFSAIQTNNYNGSGVCIDKVNRKLYYLQRIYNSIGANTNTIRVKEFNLPALTDGTEVDGVLVVSLSDADALRTFDLPVWQKYYQDSTIINGNLFQVSGTSSVPRILNVYDLTNNELIANFNLSSLVGSEPEGIDVYNGSLYISFLNRYMYKLDV